MAFWSTFHYVQHENGILQHWGTVKRTSRENTCRELEDILSHFIQLCFPVPARDFHPLGWYWSISHLLSSVLLWRDTQFPLSAPEQVLNPLISGLPLQKSRSSHLLLFPNVSSYTSKRPIPALQDLPLLADQGQGKTSTGSGQGQKRHFGRHLNTHQVLIFL